MGVGQSIKHFYETKYKALLLITLLLIPASLGILAYSKVTTGDYFQKGVTLKGGTSYTFPVSQSVDIAALQDTLTQQYPSADLTVRGVTEFGKLTAIIIEAADIDEQQLTDALRDFGVPVVQGTYSKEVLGSALGEQFFRQTLIALLVAFVMMAIVVFITFRQVAPSAYVILAVVSTILETLAVISLLGVHLSTAGIAALLMLIGYSVDTDILLTNRALRSKEGTFMSRVYRAMKTGITMTSTALITTLVAFIFTDSDVIKQMMLILTIGLLFDLINTWVQNVSVLRLLLKGDSRE
jgi:preprotein translocase subunit SecF